MEPNVINAQKRHLCGNVIYAEWSFFPGREFCRVGVLRHPDASAVIYVIYAAATQRKLRMINGLNIDDKYLPTAASAHLPTGRFGD
jgi:hypothetical protein